MKAKVNNQLLKTTTLDSGSLNILTMVVHQFDTEGRYRAIIMHQGQVVTEIDFDVDKNSKVMQLDIDLAKSARGSFVRPQDYGRQSDIKSRQVVSPEGYVLFYVSSGGGYSVVVSNSDGQEVFDSTKLGDDDLFAVSLLEPTTYKMTNTLGTSKGEIDVSLTPDAVQRIKSLETRHIDVDPKRFDTKRVELSSSQGLVFRVKGSARILIEKKSISKVKKGKPKIRWQKPKTMKEKKQGR